MYSTSTTNLMSPVIFNARGSKLDVRLEVFNTMFHAHLSILKLNSHFFFTLFDSADKTSAQAAAGGPPSKGFKYEWVTKIVDNGADWQLVSKGPNSGDLGLSTYRFKNDLDDKTRPFKYLLYAFYNRLYEIDDIEDILEMTKLARFYVALPTVSKSLYAALYQSPRVTEYMHSGYACDFLQAATELRHPQVFREALIFSLGPWEKPQYLELKDKKLKKIAKNAYNELCAKVVSVHEKLLKELHLNCYQETTKIESLTRHYVREVNKGEGEDGKICLPSFYRKLYNAETTRNIENTLEEHIKPLMKNELTLCREAPDNDPYDRWFLCVTIEDEDLPWDTTETDW